MSVVDAVLQTLNAIKLDGSYAGRTSQSDQENMETAEKLRIFHSLPVIAANLGPTETKERLIPCLSEVVSSAIKAGDDEVLLAIAEQLSGFGDLLGKKEELACVLPVLEEILSHVEEVVVVQAACDAMVKLIPQLPEDVINAKCARLIRHILDNDSYCASRKVTTQLIIACYPFLTEELQMDFKYRIFHLADSDEEVPLVRAAAVQQLVELAKLVGPNLKTELSCVLANLVLDNQRVVRAACVAPLVELGRMITDATEFDTSVGSSVDKLFNDGTRDTRRAIASSIVDLQTVACAVSSSNRSMHQLMLNLLEDNEVDTRRIAATQLKDFCLASPKDIMTNVLLPQLRDHLSLEREELVRAELVRCAVQLLPAIRREDSLPLVQQILAFLNDSNSQSKQYVFEHFANLVSLMPPNELQLTLLPSLLRLWQEKNWRVRLGVVQSIPCVYPNLPESCIRDTVLPANLAWLRDPAWYVRDCACRSLARLLRSFPNLCKEVMNGLGQKAAAAAAAAAAASGSSNSQSVPSGSGASTSSGSSSTLQSPSSSASTNATSVTAGMTSTTSTTSAAAVLNASGSNSSADAAAASFGVNSSSNAAMNSINAITAQAAAGGLKALSTDANYHFRQIYINAVQTIWGPGIPDESPYSATGDVPGMGICLPGIQSTLLLTASKSNQSTVGSDAVSPVVPENCQAPPQQLPTTLLATCVSQLLRMVADDVVANVRISAAQALRIISGCLDKKLVQKDVIPVLRKVYENDVDSDVRFCAQETLSVFN